MLIERTNTRNWVPLFARLAIFLSIFPHGAQKLFGWFGGAGFSATMEGLSKGAGLPMFIVFLVIIIESIATLLVLCRIVWVVIPHLATYKINHIYKIT